MVYKMRYGRKVWFLKGICTDKESAFNMAKSIRKKTGASYKIIKQNGLFGEYEVWLSKEGF